MRARVLTVRVLRTLVYLRLDKDEAGRSEPGADELPQREQLSLFTADEGESLLDGGRGGLG